MGSYSHPLNVGYIVQPPITPILIIPSKPIPISHFDPSVAILIPGHTDCDHCNTISKLSKLLPSRFSPSNRRSYTFSICLQIYLNIHLRKNLTVHLLSSLIPNLEIINLEAAQTSHLDLKQYISAETARHQGPTLKYSCHTKKFRMNYSRFLILNMSMYFKLITTLVTILDETSESPHYALAGG